jgi:hypothetical protein
VGKSNLCFETNLSRCDSKGMILKTIFFSSCSRGPNPTQSERGSETITRTDLENHVFVSLHAEQLLRFTLLLVSVAGQFCLAIFVCNSIYYFSDIFLSFCNPLHDEFECSTDLENMVLLLM